MNSSSQTSFPECSAVAAGGEKKWHLENYTPEHSPLAGQIEGTNSHLSSYIPNFPSLQAWNSDHRNVPSHTLSNANFNPRYLHNKRFEGIRILETLPTELRWQIYDKIIHSWSTFKAYPETTGRPHGSRIGIARRNKTPTVGPVMDVFRSNPCSPTCWKNSKFDQKHGTVDYFKECEWEDLKASIGTMVEFDTYRDSISANSLWGKRREDGVNVMEDFMAYFWDQTVLDVRFNSSHLAYTGPLTLSRPPALSEFNINDKILHSRIQHIILSATHGESSSNWLFANTNHERTLRNQPPLPLPRGASSFIQRCKFVTAHLPNLQTATIYIKIQPEALMQIKPYQKSHAKDPRALLKAFRAMVPWARTVMNIPVKKNLKVVLWITPRSMEYNTACSPIRCSRLALLNTLISKCAGVVFSPMSLNRWEGDQYFGLDELFREE